MKLSHENVFDSYIVITNDELSNHSFETALNKANEINNKTSDKTCQAYGVIYADEHLKLYPISEK